MRLKESVDTILSQTDVKFADMFYDRLFQDYPEVREYFASINMERQNVMLTMALQIFAYHYRNPNPAMANYIRVLGTLHRQAGVPPDEFPKFQSTILRTMKDFHGKEWSEELAGEWEAALTRAIELMRAH